MQSEIASARAQVRGLRTRTDFSAVSVTIEPGEASGGVGGGGNDGAWTPGDALDDAVRVLEVFAGVAVVGIAVLAPLALLGLAAGFAAAAAPPAARAGARGRLGRGVSEPPEPASADRPSPDRTILRAGLRRYVKVAEQWAGKPG